MKTYFIILLLALVVLSSGCLGKTDAYVKAEEFCQEYGGVSVSFDFSYECNFIETNDNGVPFKTRCRITTIDDNYTYVFYNDCQYAKKINLTERSVPRLEFWIDSPCDPTKYNCIKDDEI